MFILTDYSDTHPDLLGLMPGNFVLVYPEPPVDVEPPANLNSLEEVRIVGDVVLTEASQRALDQLCRDDMRAFKDFDDFDHKLNPQYS